MAEMASRCQSCELTARYKYWNELPSTKQSFFKVMANDFHHEMKIPEEFTECFKGQLAGWCILRGPSGQEWRVKITRTPKQAFFSDGWDDFVRDHGLKYLDLCVFSYSEPSTFDVLMFKMSGSEREGAYFTNKSSSFSSPLICTSSLHSHKCNVDHADFCEDVDEAEESGADDNEDDSQVQKNGKRKTPDNIEGLDGLSEDTDTYVDEEEDEDGDEDGGEEKESEEEQVQSCARRGRPSIPGGTKQRQTVHISRRRSVTKGEIQHADELASRYELRIKSMEPRMPTIKLKMRLTNVYQGFYLTIEKEWALQHMCRKNHDVKLRVPGVEGSWIVGCKWTQKLSQCQFRNQWPIFVLDNNLEEHDVCVFELVKKGDPRRRKKAVFNVCIFRVVDEVVPLEKVRMFV
ncbi:hypothetical protein Cgig2_024919 [Carnegiea gigantea]|uniref:TF-B3 domain-containing protein n=1 Tax=Carnegiea gigantea TaxID=171969 RepID=A0A9Q1KDY4_9CARY|nr:hypothetical protein Cgig2_024919 [Carnegiea gigantea]